MVGMVAPVPMGATGMRNALASSTISSTVWSRVQAWTASSTSARRGQRPNCWASTGSVARSGRPIITVKSSHCCALSMANPTHPSKAGSMEGTSTERWKTWRMKWSRSPVSEAWRGSNGLRVMERHSSAETSTKSPLPLAWAPPPCGQTPDRRPCPGDPFPRLPAGGHRLTFGGATSTDGSRRGLQRELGGRPVGPGAGLAERGDGDDRQAGIRSSEHVGSQAECVQPARRIRLDQEVGRPCEVEYLRPARRRREVGHDAALPGMEEGREGRMLSGRRRAPHYLAPPERVTVGGLHLQHLRAGVQPELGAISASQ